MKRFAPIIAILVLIGALAVLNKNINTGTAGDEDAPPPPKAAAKTSALTAIDPLPPEITLGSPATAKYKITMGWVYDSVNQPDPTALTQAIDAVKQRVAMSGGQASAEIVNLDAPLDELSPQTNAVTGLGVAVNGDAGTMVGGKEIALAGNPGEGDVSAPHIETVLKTMLTAKP